MKSVQDEKILILDFGSQYTQLIARRVREQNVYCEIVPFNIDPDQLKVNNPSGLILSGGPSSIYDKGAPIPDQAVFNLGVPVLGICYGLQVIGRLLNGEVNRAAKREFGRARFNVDNDEGLFEELTSSLDVWMSHGDQLTRIPEGFTKIGHTQNADIAAVADFKRKIFGVQFHPEVAHTPKGTLIIRNFLYRICGCHGYWTPEYFVESSVQKIRDQVGKGKVVCGLSGGVDSAVTAALIYKAIGKQLIPVFVDNGLLRKEESEEVQKTFQYMDLQFVDASDAFLKDLKGITDPEKKRKQIGKRFIRIFEEKAASIGKIDFLAQGTLYPDVIESTSTWGPSATIKSHHNVGGLPDTMRLKLVEPLRELFKDEVRAAGRVLSLPDHIINRHPFPGPGLAVRILGEITKERLDLLREADILFINELKACGWYDKV